jgi:hypothetical protein
MPGPVLSNPLIQFVGLAALTLLARGALTRVGPPAAGSAAALMAIGIFSLDALQHLPVPDLSTVTQLVAVELLVLAVLLGVGLAVAHLSGTAAPVAVDLRERYGAGTWVAASSVLAGIVLFGIPGWRALAFAFGALSVGLWLWYLTFGVVGLRIVAADPIHDYAKGWLLLLTVATQSILLAGTTLFPGDMPRLPSIALLALGGVLYLACAGLIAARYVLRRCRGLRDDWDNTNCILHGALSITGLAAVNSEVLTGRWLVALWVLAAAILVAVETIEIVRAYLRVRDLGWRRGLFTYSVSQWARNFTVGMFYAFTLHLHIRMTAAGAHIGLDGLWNAIAEYGQYVVLILLLVEIALYVRESIRLPRNDSAHAPVQPA